MNPNIPFGIPNVGFMQTGNQQMSLEQPQAVDDPFTKPDADPFTKSDVDPFTKSDDGFEVNENEFEKTDVNSKIKWLGGSNFPQQSLPVKEITKYAIFDMFWLINPKVYKKVQLLQNEAQFAVISFNISFGNLRISFFNLSNNAIQNNIVYLENLKRTVTGTIYPATAFNAFNTPRLSTICIEQLFRQIPGAAWQIDRPVCKIEKNETKLRFTITDSKNGTYFYDFEDWQYNAFHKALEFTFTKGFELNALYHMNK